MLAVALAALLSGCTGGSAAPAPEWTTGFWFWYGSSARVKASVPVDVLYVQAGTMQRESVSLGDRGGTVSGGLYDAVPPARSYWLVYRMDSPGLAEVEEIPSLAKVVGKTLEEARQRGMGVAGVQLDIDSPTGRLREYAAFLREFRKALPAGTELSITALLDWFRSGTAIAEVLAEVDEFVPQFYDVEGREDGTRSKAIAVSVDAARLGPAFERFGKRYRIGVSSFGRTRFVSAAKAEGTSPGVVYMQDMKQLDLALHPAFRMSSTRTRAQEAVVRYEALKPTKIEWDEFHQGDAFEFVLPTSESMQAGAAAARKMGKHCAGVLFFRWPAPDESLAAPPDHALRAAGALANAPPGSSLLVADRKCSAVYCADLYLLTPEPLNPEPVRYRIRSTAELEYFLPWEHTPASMTGPHELAFSLPAFCGRPRLYLGRAVAKTKCEFQLEAEK